MSTQNQSIDPYLVGLDKETGELKFFDLQDDGKLTEHYSRAQAVARKYMMLSAVREMLPVKLELPSGKLIKPRTRFCLRGVATTASSNPNEHVSIYKSKEFNTASYKNLMLCGAGHACPVCRSKISARRAEEIKEYIVKHEDAGHKCQMLTFTFSHTKDDDLYTIVKRLKSAYRGFKELRAVKNVRKLIGEFEFGSVSSFEATHSFANGWHPHLHCLWFVKNGTNKEAVHEALATLWCDYAEKKGLGRPSEKRGLDVRDADDIAADYILKIGSDWDASKEITNYASKKAKGDSRNPFQLITSFMDDDDQSAKMLFIEYVAATHGIHIIDVTTKLKKNYGTKDSDKTDEELAEESTDKADLLGYLTREQWKIVVLNSSRKFDARALVLLIAEREFSRVNYFIEGLRKRSVKYEQYQDLPA